MKERIRETLLKLENAAASTPCLTCVKPLSWLYHTGLAMQQSGLLEGMPSYLQEKAYMLAEQIEIAAEGNDPDPLMAGLFRRLLNTLIMNPAHSTQDNSNEKVIRDKLSASADRIRLTKPFSQIMEEIWRCCPSQIREEEISAWEDQEKVLKEQFDGYLGIRQSLLLDKQIRCRAQELRWLKKKRGQMLGIETISLNEEELMFRKEDVRKQKEDLDEHYSEMGFYPNAKGEEATHHGADTFQAEYAGD